MSVRIEQDKLGKEHTMCDRRWPDNTRFRRNMPNRRVALDMDARIRTAIIEGSWQTLKEKLERGTSGRLTVREFAQQYLEEYCKVHNRRWKRKVTSLRPIVQKLGGLPMESVQPKHVHGFIRWRKKENPKISNASINRDLAALKHMLAYAKEVGAVRENLIRDFKKLMEVRCERPKATEAQIDHLLDCADRLVRPILGFIRETGCRLEEALSLRHQQVRKPDGIVVFTDNTKSGKFRLAPLTDAALDWLGQVSVLPGCPFVFWNDRSGTRWFNIRKRFNRARELAGLPWFLIKDLRRHYGILLAENGAEMHVIQAVLGHASVRTTEQHYAHFSPQYAARRAFQVLQGRKTGGMDAKVKAG